MNNSKMSFACALVSFIIMTPVSILLVKSVKTGVFEFSGMLAIIVCIAVVVSIIGLVYAIKGLREKNTARKILGFIWNGGISCLFIGGIISSLLVR